MTFADQFAHLGGTSLVNQKFLIKGKHARGLGLPEPGEEVDADDERHIEEECDKVASP